MIDSSKYYNKYLKYKKKVFTTTMGGGNERRAVLNEEESKKVVLFYFILLKYIYIFNIPNDFKTGKGLMNFLLDGEYATKVYIKMITEINTLIETSSNVLKIINNIHHGLLDCIIKKDKNFMSWLNDPGNGRCAQSLSSNLDKFTKEIKENIIQFDENYFNEINEHYELFITQFNKIYKTQEFNYEEELFNTMHEELIKKLKEFNEKVNEEYKKLTRKDPPIIEDPKFESLDEELQFDPRYGIPPPKE